MRGVPDDSDVTQIGDLYRLLDMGELAARLGSIVTYHRLGNVVWMDGFETGMAAWTATYSGTGAGVRVSNLSALSGGASLMLNTGIGGTPSAQVSHTLAPGNTTTYGVCLGFTLDVSLAQLIFFLEAVRAGYTQKYRIRIRPTANEMDYWDETGNWHLLSALPPMLWDARVYHLAKMVVDVESASYGLLYLNEKSYDMRMLLPQVQSYAGAEFVRLTLQAVGDGTFPALVYVDNVVMTTNEYL